MGTALYMDMRNSFIADAEDLLSSARTRVSSFPKMLRIYGRIRYFSRKYSDGDFFSALRSIGELDVFIEEVARLRSTLDECDPIENIGPIGKALFFVLSAASRERALSALEDLYLFARSYRVSPGDDPVSASDLLASIS